MILQSQRSRQKSQKYSGCLKSKQANRTLDEGNKTAKVACQSQSDRIEMH